MSHLQHLQSQKKREYETQIFTFQLVIFPHRKRNMAHGLKLQIRRRIKILPPETSPITLSASSNENAIT